jgi:hypothetical protein
MRQPKLFIRGFKSESVEYIFIYSPWVDKPNYFTPNTILKVTSQHVQLQLCLRFKIIFFNCSIVQFVACNWPTVPTGTLRLP